MFGREENYLMRTRTETAILVAIMFVALAGYSSESSAETNVNISIGSPLPRVVIHEPPQVVVIPGTYVYLVPDVGPDFFFYHGYWYRPHHGHWYRAKGYNGPWKKVKKGKVPHVVRDLPPDFRRTVRYHERIRHADLKKNWQTWEQKKHWDKHNNRHEGPEIRKDGRWEESHDRHDYKKGERVPDGKREGSPGRHDYEKEVKEARSGEKEISPSRYEGKGEHDHK